MVKMHAPSDQQVLGLRNKYSRVYRDMLKPPLPVTIDLSTEQVVPKHPQYNLPKDPILIWSTFLRRGTNVPLCLSTIDNEYPHVCWRSCQLGSTGMVHWHWVHKLKNIQTHQLPRVIPVYQHQWYFQWSQTYHESLTWGSSTRITLSRQHSMSPHWPNYELS